MKRARSAAEGGAVLTVGCAFMQKKRETMQGTLERALHEAPDVHFVLLDVDQDFEEQAPALDVILHKLTDDLLHISSRHDCAARVDRLRNYLARHPHCSLVAPLTHVARVLHRDVTCSTLLQVSATDPLASAASSAPASSITALPPPAELSDVSPSGNSIVAGLQQRHAVW